MKKYVIILFSSICIISCDRRSKTAEVNSEVISETGTTVFTPLPIPIPEDKDLKRRVTVLEKEVGTLKKENGIVEEKHAALQKKTDKLEQKLETHSKADLPKLVVPLISKEPVIKVTPTKKPVVKKKIVTAPKKKASSNSLPKPKAKKTAPCPQKKDTGSKKNSTDFKKWWDSTRKETYGSRSY